MVSSKKLGVAPLGIIFLLISCVAPGTGPDAVAPLASTQQNNLAMTFYTIHDKSVVYLFRSRALPYLRTLIFVDNREIGFTISNTYMRLELNPGEHKIVSRTDSPGNRSNTFHSRPNAEFKFTLDAEAGNIYFIRQSPYFWSWDGKLDLHLAAEEEGMHEITYGRYQLLDPLGKLSE